MNKPRPCGCKGIRTCLTCEKQYGVEEKPLPFLSRNLPSYVYCPLCNKAYPGWHMESWRSHPKHDGEPLDYPGIFIQLDFISESEAQELMDSIETEPWDQSQSGRRKQNYGPKCNFKKKRVVLGNFNGFPQFTEFIQKRFEDVNILQNYKTVEQCSLEYDPSTGACIDPHVDDCWIWGERIVTVNVLGDSVLTMSRCTVGTEKYNLGDVKTYPKVVTGDGICSYTLSSTPDIIIRIPMPRRSLLVLYGSARYDWEHCVLRQDVHERRVCIAYRELTPTYLDGGSLSNIGLEILSVANKFW